jgi:hypothetical protein
MLTSDIAWGLVTTQVFVVVYGGAVGWGRKWGLQCDSKGKIVMGCWEIESWARRKGHRNNIPHKNNPGSALKHWNLQALSYKVAGLRTLTSGYAMHTWWNRVCQCDLSLILTIVSKDMLVNGAFNFHSDINHYALSKCYKYTPGKKRRIWCFIHLITLQKATNYGLHENFFIYIFLRWNQPSRSVSYLNHCEMML